MDGPRDSFIASWAQVGHLVPWLPSRGNDLRSESVGYSSRRRKQRSKCSLAAIGKSRKTRHPYARFGGVSKLYRQVLAARLESKTERFGAARGPMDKK